MELLLGLPQPLALILITLGTLLVGYLKFKVYNPSQSKNNPPGSLGFPLIGDTVGFLKAVKNNKFREWIESRIAKYGPIFKASLFGTRVVFITGQAGNKFIFSANEAIASNQPASLSKIVGRNGLLELSTTRHKLVRGAMMSFLRPESIQRFVVEMDSIVKTQILQELRGKDSVKVVNLMKKITFKVASSLLFGLPEGKEREALFEDFTITFKGTSALPLRFPGTVFYQACQARNRVCKTLSSLLEKRKKEMEEGRAASDGDIMSSFLSLRDEKGEPLSEEEIIDNLVFLVFASHDTSTILLTFLIRHLARDNRIYNKVLEEQNEIAKSMEGSDGKLRWSDVQKMKFTWRVAKEVLRLIPPIFANIKRITKNTSFGGFDVAKGWQVCWVASSTHMDGNIFDDPEKFDPSRFEHSSKHIPPYTYIPFGAGPRACPGADFARMEVLLTIHYLIRNYKWTEMIPDEPIKCEPLPFPAIGLPIKLHPRNDSEVNI